MFLAKNVSFLYFLQEIGSGVDTEILKEIASYLDTEFQRNSAPAWTPIFQLSFIFETLKRTPIFQLTKFHF
ncbi:unnamed protein product [Rhizophagus irregularis]|nr:unnamed protein product [Rhizophagus irregularis]